MARTVEGRTEMNDRERRRLERLRREFLRRAKPYWRKRQPLPPSVAKIAAEYGSLWAVLRDPIELAAAELGVRASELRRWIAVAQRGEKRGRRISAMRAQTADR